MVKKIVVFLFGGFFEFFPLLGVFLLCKMHHCIFAVLQPPVSICNLTAQLRTLQLIPLISLDQFEHCLLQGVPSVSTEMFLVGVVEHTPKEVKLGPYTGRCSIGILFCTQCHNFETTSYLLIQFCQRGVER